MADLSELEAALVKADAAGDVDGAKVLAGEVRRMRGQPTPEPGLMDQALSGIKTGFRFGGPMGAAIGAIPAASKALDQAAYETGGKVTDVTGSPKLGFAANVAMQAVPAVVGGLGGKVAAPLLEDAATGLMKSALKPTLKDWQTGRAATAIQTMLDEGVNVSQGGVMKLRQKIYDLNNEIANKIMASPEVVDKNAVYGPIKETLDKFTKQVNPTADVAKIKAAWEEFINHPLLSGSSMPVQLAQELKQGTYRILSKKYGEAGSAETEAQKAIARGLKDQVAQAVPEVSGLNAQESNLITALKVAERRTMMEGNKNPMGLAMLTHNPAAWAAFMADRSGAAKSMLARLLNSGSETLPQLGIGGIGATAQGSLAELQRRQQ